MKLLLKRFLRNYLNKRGFQIVPWSQHPPSNGMGLDKIGISTVLDVGANAGQFAGKIHTLLPSAEIFSFEPLIEEWKTLKQVFEKERITGRAFNFALGEKSGTTTINRHVTHSPSSSLLATTSLHESLDSRTAIQARETIAIRTLDDVVASESLHLKEKLLIKMDVQGFEDRVIRGGTVTFGKADVVLTEIMLDPLYEGQARFDGIANMLTDRGFHYAGNFDQWQGDDGHVMGADLLFLRNRQG